MWSGGVLYVYSWKIVGWEIDTRQTPHLVWNALEMALEARKPKETAIHSDHGTQSVHIVGLHQSDS